jgi:peptidoglycan/LPS O-acetylase OafA/YrhL
MRHRNDFIHMLRGVAALSVVAFHVFGHTDNPSAPLALACEVTSYGWLGVPVFFVISGFVIANSLRSAWVTPKYAGNYALRRIIRLDPPYWTTIFVAIAFRGALALIVGDPVIFPSWQRVVAHLFYLQNILGFKALSVGLWTLCLEVQFYLSMLVLVAACQRSGVALSLVVAVLGAGSLLLSPDMQEVAFTAWFSAGVSLLPNFSMFAIGILAWMRVTDRISWRAWIAANVVVAARLAFQLDLEIAAALLAGNAIVLNATGKVYVPRLQSLMFLGTVSYSLYLIHMIAARTFQLGTRRFLGIDGDSSLLFCSLAILFSIGVAWVMFRLIERPSMALAESLKLPQVASGHAAELSGSRPAGGAHVAEVLH